jgi:acyl carrier protein
MDHNVDGGCTMTVEQIIGKVFNIDSDNVNDHSSKETIEGWDAMGHLSLVMALEERFKINLSIADAIEMTSVKKIKDTLGKYGAV